MRPFVSIKIKTLAITSNYSMVVRVLFNLIMLLQFWTTNEAPLPSPLLENDFVTNVIWTGLMFNISSPRTCPEHAQPLMDSRSVHFPRVEMGGKFSKLLMPFCENTCYEEDLCHLYCWIFPFSKPFLLCISVKL